MSKGIKVQPSRFAALNLDSDSDSDVSGGGGWIEVAKGTRQKGKEGDAATRTAVRQHRDGAQGDKSLSKSAKKRARKKRSQQSSSEVSVTHRAILYTVFSKVYICVFHASVVCS